MSITKLILRTNITNIADANGSTRWTTTASTGEVDIIAGYVHAREWKRILNAQPYYRTQKLTPTSDSSGQFTIASFTTGTTDAIKNFYRVLLVAINNVPYTEMLAKDAFMATVNGGPYLAWYRDGSYLVAPDSPSTVATGIWVNWYPVRADLLSTDSIVVDFPTDYEPILYYEGAAMMLDKGGAETDASAELRARAEIMRQDMLQDISRFSIKPIVMQFSDSPGDWGA